MVLPSRWDESEGLLVGKGGGPGYATRLTSANIVHPTRASADYAVALAEYKHHQAAERIARIVDRLSELQDVNPNSPTFGTWSWYIEEPLSQMRPPDLNWANFIGARLCELLWDHRSYLTPAGVAKVERALENACVSIINRNVPPAVTNIYVMGIRVTLMAGKLLQRPDFDSYGRACVMKLDAYTRKNGGFSEYNSPVYTVTALVELEGILHYINDPEVVTIVRPLWVWTWQEIASHFHYGTGEWAGPHSRSYTDFLPALQRGQIDVRRGLPITEKIPIIPSRRMMLDCPTECAVFYTPEVPTPRNIHTRFHRFEDTGEEVWGTTWFEKEVCLGSASIANTWAQTHGVIAYWKAGAKPAVFRVRLLKDGADFAAFGLRSAQTKRRTLFVTYPLARGGDKLPTQDWSIGGFECKEIALRLSVEGAVADDRYELICQEWKVVVSTARCMFDGRDVKGQWTTMVNGNLAVLELRLPTGGRINTRTLSDTVFIVAATVAETDQVVHPEPVRVADQPGRVAVSWGDLSVTAPSVPASR